MVSGGETALVCYVNNIAALTINVRLLSFILSTSNKFTVLWFVDNFDTVLDHFHQPA